MGRTCNLVVLTTYFYHSKAVSRSEMPSSVHLLPFAVDTTVLFTAANRIAY